jgi:hypothetical protein
VLAIELERNLIKSDGVSNRVFGSNLSIYLPIYFLVSNCSKGDTCTSLVSSVFSVETTLANTKQLERSCIGMADSIGLLATMFKLKLSTHVTDASYVVGPLVGEGFGND